MSAFDGDSDGKSFGKVCAHHTRAIPGESYLELTSRDHQLRAIAVLQQRVRFLEAKNTPDE
jgi:hypothetical protein